MDAPPQVETVIVQTARLPDAAGDPAFSIVQIDTATLGSTPRLDDALTSVPGFALYRRTSSLGANPTTQGVSLRGIAGSGASRALVTLDGVPRNDPFGGWVIWTALPAEALSQATVVRGAGAGAYGAGALTGVVALDGTSGVPGHIAGDVAVGQEGYVRAAGITQFDVGKTKAFIAASDEENGGWIPVRQGRGAADTPLALRDWSLSERTETDLGGAELTQRIGAYQEKRSAGTWFADSRAKGVQGSLSLVAQPRPDSLGWRVNAWVEGSDLANTSASVAANRDTATLANNQYATPAYGVGLNAEVRRQTATYSWELGVDGRDYDGESKEDLYSQGTPTGNRVSGGGEAIAGLYLETSRTLGRLLLTGGARLDGWEDYASKLIQTGNSPLDQHPGDRGGVVPSGRIGLRWDATSDLYLRSAAYTGFRPATLNELHRSFRVGNDVTEANSALSPERLYGAEAGLGGKGWLTWDADIFFNQLANAITNVTIGHGPGSFPIAGFVPAGGTLYQRENAGDVNACGVEGEARHDFGAAFSLRAAFDYTHARVDGGSQAPQLTGLRPALTPTATATGGANWRPLSRLTLSADLRYESARFDDDQNTRPIKAGTQVDARAELRLTQALNVYISAENLFDAALQTGRGAAGVVTYDAPRLVMIGVNWRR